MYEHINQYRATTANRGKEVKNSYFEFPWLQFDLIIDPQSFLSKLCPDQISTHPVLSAANYSAANYSAAYYSATNYSAFGAAYYY